MSNKTQSNENVAYKVSVGSIHVGFISLPMESDALKQIYNKYHNTLMLTNV